MAWERWRRARNDLRSCEKKLQRRFVHVSDRRWWHLSRYGPREAWARWKDLTGQAPKPVELPVADVVEHYRALGQPETAVLHLTSYVEKFTVFMTCVTRFVPCGAFWSSGPPVMTAPIMIDEAVAAFQGLNLNSAAGVDCLDGILAERLFAIFIN